MWPFGIELVHEVIEARLLLQGVHAWRSGCLLFEGQMHARGLEGLAHEQEARGLVGYGQRVAVSAVTELELALEVGAPQLVGRESLLSALVR